MPLQNVARVIKMYYNESNKEAKMFLCRSGRITLNNNFPSEWTSYQ